MGAGMFEVVSGEGTNDATFFTFIRGRAPPALTVHSDLAHEFKIRTDPNIRHSNSQALTTLLNHQYDNGHDNLVAVGPSPPLAVLTTECGDRAPGV